MILVDTTVLVYSVGTDHALRTPCRELLRLVEEGRVRATTTVEVLQEFAHVRARRRSREDAAAVARSAAIGLSPLVHPELEDLIEGLELFQTTERLGAFDAVLAAGGNRLSCGRFSTATVQKRPDLRKRALSGRPAWGAPAPLPPRQRLGDPARPPPPPG